MEDIHCIILITIIAYIIEYLKIQFNLTFINIILFINLLGLYHFIKNLRFNLIIEYNHN
jgi:hypothetical protein